MAYEFYDWDGILVRREGGVSFPEKLDGGKWVAQMIHDTMTSLYPVSEEEAKGMADGADLNAEREDKAEDTGADIEKDEKPGKKLTEAGKVEDQADKPEDTLVDTTEDKATGEVEGSKGMTVAQIRDAGYAIDLPFEAPDAQPAPLRYAEATEGREEWIPPEGFTMGGVPWESLPVIEGAPDDAPVAEPKLDAPPPDRSQQ